MTQITRSAAPIARRGEVERSFHPARVLAGFMDDGHFQACAQEHLASLSKAKQTALMKRVSDARTKVLAFPPLSDPQAEIRPLAQGVYDKFSKDKTFLGVFGGRSFRFAWVKLNKLIALQAFVNLQIEDVPESEEALIDFAFPKKWNVPAEVSFIPPMGPIYIVSSSPHLAGLNIRVEGKKGQIIIEPPLHINLIQVMHFGGRYYLRNGYHRVAGAISLGRTELPALIVDGNQPAEVELLNMGANGFNAAYSMSLPRPPLVSDFSGDASVEILMRERRYGASVALQISPVNIGV